MRPDSLSEQLLRSALGVAHDAGADTVLLPAGELDLPMYEPDSVARTPAARHLVAELRRADGVILCSPGYHGGMSGMLKNALDYAEDLRDADRPYLEGRAVACIAVASGWQATTTTLVAMRSLVHALRGWPTPLGVAVNSTAMTADSIATGQVGRQLRVAAEQVVWFAHLATRAAG